LIPSRAFNEALPRAELHPLDILSLSSTWTTHPLPLSGS